LLVVIVVIVLAGLAVHLPHDLIPVVAGVVTLVLFIPLAIRTAKREASTNRESRDL